MTRTQSRVRKLERETGRKVFTRSELSTLLGVRALDRALADGVIRAGVTGLWLREQPDPGAVAVLRNALAGA